MEQLLSARVEETESADAALVSCYTKIFNMGHHVFIQKNIAKFCVTVQ